MIILDVRTPEEYQEAHIDSAVNLPLSHIYEYTLLAQDVLGKIVESDKLGKHVLIKVHCASGGRSAVACQLLKQQGFTDVQNLGGFYEACRCVASA